MSDAGKNDIFGINQAMRIAILVLDGAFDTGLSTVLDVLTTANELAANQAMPAPPFEVTLVGMRPQVTTAQGFSVSVTEISDYLAPDIVIVPALGYKTAEPLLAALVREDVQAAITRLRSWAGNGTCVAAGCIGTFVLAESGLLDQQDATTTWWLTPLFRQRYPKVRLDTSRMVVSSGQFVTSGAALSHIDMTLMLIHRVSPDLAALVANYLVVDSRPSQSAYIISNHLSHADPLVERFDRWARAHMAKGFNLDDAASELATSKRTLARRIRDVLGKTPVSYVQDIRIEHAVHLLKTSNTNVDRIAELVGYADGVTLRTLLRRRLGKGVREIRGA